MSAPFVLFACLIFVSTCTSAPSAGKNEELGKAIDIRKANLLGDFQELERTIFEPFKQECFIDETKKSQSSRKFMEYYENSRAFYSSLATQSELDVSLQSSYTLGISLQVATKSKSSQSNKVSGLSLNAVAINEKILVRRGCLEGDEATLTHEFQTDLENLPEKIEDPWETLSWKPYHNFLTTYGSHVITSVTLGASFRQMTFAESSKSYSERDFEVKSCLSLGGPTAAGELGFKACSNVTESEKSEASQISTNDKVFVLGGSLDTRNKLLDQETRSGEEIQNLLNEASEQPSAIEHTFVPIWNILQSRFKIGSANNIRGLNLQYYYLGFLNYGCSFVKGGNVEIQKFDYSTSSTKTSPEFECSLAKEGCQSDNDCHYKPVWCSCHGKSCVRYKTETHDNGSKKETAYANSADTNWGWHGCGWKVAGFYCRCANPDRNMRKVVWSLPSRDCPTHGARSHSGYRQTTKDAVQKKPKVKEERE